MASPPANFNLPGFATDSTEHDTAASRNTAVEPEIVHYMPRISPSQAPYLPPSDAPPVADTKPRESTEAPAAHPARSSTASATERTQLIPQASQSLSDEQAKSLHRLMPPVAATSGSSRAKSPKGKKVHVDADFYVRDDVVTSHDPLLTRDRESYYLSTSRPSSSDLFLSKSVGLVLERPRFSQANIRVPDSRDA